MSPFYNYGNHILCGIRASFYYYRSKYLKHQYVFEGKQESWPLWMYSYNWKERQRHWAFFSFLASKYIFFPNWLFPIWYIKDYLELDNPQDWISLLLTKTFWWMVLSYIFLSSTNIFLKHSIQSYYWDSSLSEIKSLFYFLSVLASRMYPNIFDFKKTFFFSLYYWDFSFLFSDIYLYTCRTHIFPVVYNVWSEI